MTLRFAALAAVVVAAAAFAAPSAHALPAAPGIAAPSLIEDVACRMVRSRMVLPNGRVVWRTVRRCTPDIRPGWRGRDCRMVRERVVRPGGAVVYRTIRRCR